MILPSENLLIVVSVSSSHTMRDVDVAPVVVVVVDMLGRVIAPLDDTDDANGALPKTPSANKFLETVPLLAPPTPNSLKLACLRAFFTVDRSLDADLIISW